MKTVVGLFDNFDDAQQTVRDLLDAGFSNENVNLIANDKSGQYAQYLKENPQTKGKNVADGAAAGAGVGAVLGGLGGLLLGLGALMIPGIGPVIAAGPIATTLAGAGVGAVTGGIVGALVDLGIPEQNAKLYAEGVRHGGTLVVVQSPDNMAQRAADILNRHHPIDVERRAATWQESQAENASVPVTGSVDTTIPVIEEDIKVGKRQVDQGGVRIERTEEEAPFEQNVNLREEHVNVERRPTNREATPEDFDAFQEGTMELKETAEEPVVEKRARVVEEVDINKDVENKTETVRDTLHRQDVNVEPINRQTSMNDQDWNTFDQDFRNDFQTRFTRSGNNYAYYLPAYRYGYDLARNPQYQSYDWYRLEPVAQRDWQQRGGQGAWQDVKDAVRHAWESAKNKL